MGRTANAVRPKFPSGAWLGLAASALGIISALYFARAAGRTFDDQRARDALPLLEAAFAKNKTDVPSGDTADLNPTATATKDLTGDILRKNKESQGDMKIGTRLLLVSFGLLVLQSLTMFCTAK